MDNQVDTIFITYKDRFIRFGYDWFERLCKMHNTEIVVLNNIETSPTQEKNDRSLKSGENNDSSSKSKTLSRSNNEEGS